jgi:hypothetical protein
MSEISNSALSRAAWKRYQAQYDQIDWEQPQGKVRPHIEGMLVDVGDQGGSDCSLPLSNDNDPLRTTL